MIRPLRVAFIGTRGVPAAEGGIERHVEELGSRLASRGHQVTVYCRTNYVRERPSSYRGMRLRYVPTVGTKSLDFITHSGLSSLLVLRDSPDVVHYHAIGSALVAPLPRYLTRSRVVLTVHGLDYNRRKWSGAARAALKVGEALSARVPHATITVSQALAHHYMRHLGRQPDYIPNGMPDATRRMQGRMAEKLGLSGRPYFLFVGRLVPEKAPDLLIRAFSGVPGEARLVIAGSSGFTDSYADLLRRQAASDPRVVMAGGVYGDDLAELYSNAAAFILPSSLEGLPLTLLEALAYDSPIIVSDIPPHLEVVGQDGPGHRVVPQGDAVALTAAMAGLLASRDREAAEARSFSLRLRARYSWEAITTATEEVYERELSRRGVPAPLAERL